MSRARLASVSAEFEDARLGDARLNRRLVQLAATLSREPEASLPVATESDAALEATYRFLNNERVSPESILAPHVRATVQRASESHCVVVAHDTSEFNFGSSEREDLGRVGQGKSFGFYGHVALAVDQVSGAALGVLGVLVHQRRGGKGRRGHEALQSAEDNESRRWLALVREVEEKLGRGRAVHVMDREGDSYALLAELATEEARFVVRMASAKRKLVGPDDTIGEALSKAPVVARRVASITERAPSKMPAYRKNFPERSGRLAKLEIAAADVTVVRPDSSSRSPSETLKMNAIRVFEPSPPDGEPAVEWRLWTNQPIDSEEQVLAVVDAYRRRWVIEEYFKALKTGCAIEKRQLESSAGLKNTLAVFIPIAWRLLQLRTLARESSSQGAKTVLPPSQLRCLTLALTNRGRPPLPEHPTVRDALLGIAALGGHIKNNGDPGWIVLGRGLDKLLLIDEGHRLATTSEM